MSKRRTVAARVRQTQRAARRATPSRETDRKRAVVRDAAQHAFPTAEIDQMLAEIMGITRRL